MDTHTATCNLACACCEHTWSVHFVSFSLLISLGKSSSINLLFTLVTLPKVVATSVWASCEFNTFSMDYLFCTLCNPALLLSQPNIYSSARCSACRELCGNLSASGITYIYSTRYYCDWSHHVIIITWSQEDTSALRVWPLICIIIYPMLICTAGLCIWSCPFLYNHVRVWESVCFRACVRMCVITPYQS